MTATIAPAATRTVHRLRPARGDLPNELLLQALLEAWAAHDHPGRPEVAEQAASSAVAAYTCGASLSEAVRVGRHAIDGTE